MNLKRDLEAEVQDLGAASRSTSTRRAGGLAWTAMIGAMVGWLASDDGSFATGADFSINGGPHLG